MEFIYFLVSFSIITILVGITYAMRSPDEFWPQFRTIVDHIRTGWLKLMGMFILAGIPWSIGFALWGGFGGLGASVLCFFSILQKPTRWEGRNLLGHVEAARRNRVADEQREQMGRLFAVPLIAWVVISLIVIYSTNFPGYCPWPPR